MNLFGCRVFLLLKLYRTKTFRKYMTIVKIEDLSVMVTEKLTLRWRASAIRAWSWNLNLDNFNSSILFTANDSATLSRVDYLLKIAPILLIQPFSFSLLFKVFSLYRLAVPKWNLWVRINFPAMWRIR